MKQVRMHLLRHGRVPSHQGDMALSDDAGAEIAEAADRLCADLSPDEEIVFLTTATRRAAQTAELLRQRLEDRLGRPMAPARESWALRNPDLYLGGERVEMVSTATAFARQLGGGRLAEQDVLDHPFFRGFLTAPDRIAFWLAQSEPPGETAEDVARRILRFGASFLSLPGRTLRVLCISHSPVQRAAIIHGLGLLDPGEPGWVEDVCICFDGRGSRFRFRGARGVVEESLARPDGLEAAEDATRDGLGGPA